MQAKKKISKKDWDYIGIYNHAAKWIRPFCTYRLIFESDRKYIREQLISLPLYVLLFVPVHVLQLFCCLWSGGLKEFEFETPYLGSDHLTRGEPAFERAEKIWNK